MRFDLQRARNQGRGQLRSGFGIFLNNDFHDGSG
jgi:hypothetical protein